MFYRRFCLLLACLPVWNSLGFVRRKAKYPELCAAGGPTPINSLMSATHPGHVISITQTTCTWTKPLTIEGVQDTEGVSSQISEVQGSTFTSHGYFVDTMANGDKIFLRYQATVTLADGEVQSIQGTWTYTGGTGKFKGIQGDGAFSGNAGGRGNSYDLEGEYTLPK